MTAVWGVRVVVRGSTCDAGIVDGVAFLRVPGLEFTRAAARLIADTDDVASTSVVTTAGVAGDD
jgi:hypothetical protein